MAFISIHSKFSGHAEEAFADALLETRHQLKASRLLVCSGHRMGVGHL